MRPIMWVLVIVLVALLIVTFAAPKVVPKREVVAIIPKEPSMPEEAVSAQIPQKQEYGIPTATLQAVSLAIGSDAIETPLPEVDPVMLEAHLQAPLLTPKENMAKALMRVESTKFYEKVKRARDGADTTYQIKGAVFSSKDKILNEKENQ